MSRRSGPNGNRVKNNVRGRPHKIMDDKVFNDLVALIEAGNYVQVACSAVGISEASYYRAMSYGRDMEAELNEREDADHIFDLIDQGSLQAASNYLGRDDDGEIDFSIQDCRLVQFRRAVTRSAALAEATAVLQIRKAMPNNWKAAVEFLERRFPQRWRKRIEIGDGESFEDDGIDEEKLLSDPKAVELLHDALERVAQLPPGKSTLTLNDEDVEEVTVDRDDQIT